MLISTIYAISKAISRLISVYGGVDEAPLRVLAEDIFDRVNQLRLSI